MAYYTYNALTRQLLAIADTELPTPEDGSCTEFPGVSALELQSNYTWDENSVTFVYRPNGRLISKLDYMNRFTDAELAQIYTAAKTTVAIEIWLDKFKLAESIYLDDPRTISGVQTMELVGLIAPGRAAEILA